MRIINATVYIYDVIYSVAILACYSFVFLRTLFEAAAKGDQLLLERALNSEFGYLDHTDLNQALLRGSQNGNAECVSRLLAEGADIDCDDYDGDTPLMLAAANNHVSKCHNDVRYI